jgi:peptidoglycan/LPS O-acetylase OafA/YrhL
VYLIARYETASSHILSLPLPVRLGVASYSIYMLHEIVPSAFKRLGLQSPDIAIGWDLGWRPCSSRADQQRVIMR